MGAPCPCSLALCLLCCTAARAPTPHTEPAPTAVAPPFNLVMESSNLNTTLYWDYQHTSLTPRFTVQIRFYISGTTSLVENCRNITDHFCDLSPYVKNPNDFYWGKVKAVMGNEESDYAESASLYLPKQGKLGPPTLVASMEGEDVFIEVFHPVTPFKRNLTLLDIYEDFTYIVYLGEKEMEFEDQECDLEACSTTVPPLEKGAVLCISAKGISKLWALSSEKSEETCLNVIDNGPIKDHIYNQAMIVVFSLFGIVLLMLGMAFVYKVIQRKKIKLPKSLAFLALNRGANFIGEDPPPEDVSPVSVINERDRLLDQQPKSEMIDESLVQETEVGSQMSMGNSSGPIPDGAEEIPDEYAAPNSSSSDLGKEIFFPSDTSATETGSVTSSSAPMDTLVEVRTENTPPPAVVRESFGYDKPHAPLFLST